jgi:ABC-type glycerol-3-phosphate transport system substrate-binding protein
MKILKKVFICGLLMIFAFSISSCRKKTDLGQAQKIKKNITIQVWNVFDDSSLYEPIFSEFESKYLGLNIEYRKFENPDEYLNLIINEMAEGEGPDIFFMHNSWVTEHFKKISPADISYIPPQAFKDTFVSVASDDFVLKGEDSVEKVYAMPLYIDNLAMFYNKSHFEEKLPSAAKPAKTWEQIKEQVYTLTDEDKSFERFFRSGIAIGRADNISRAFDALQLLLLQTKADFYNQTYSSAIFATQQGVTSSGQAFFPAKEALQLYTSFAMSGNKEYSWNRYIANPNSVEKEIIPFSNGKVSMILGYSYLYTDLINQLDLQAKKGIKTISKGDIGISAIPQIFNEESGETKVTLESYFAPTVSRTSENAQIAWELISFMAKKENQEYYNEQTHRPSSRRDLVEEEKADSIYGVFASQLGYAKSLKMADSKKYQEIFLNAINAVLDNKMKAVDAMKVAQDEINKILVVKPILTSNMKTDEKVEEKKTTTKK